MKIIGPYAGGVLLGTVLPEAELVAWALRRPAVSGLAARLPEDVGRAFTPAGGACGGAGFPAGEIVRPANRPQAGGDGQAVSRRTGPAAGGCKHPPLRRGACRSAVFACRGTRRANLAAGRFRSCRTFAGGCRAGVHARRGSLRRRWVFGGRDRPRRKSPTGERWQASGIYPQKPGGGRMQASAPTQGGCRSVVFACRGTRRANLGPAVSGFDARLPEDVGRAFTPAGEGCGGAGFSAGEIARPANRPQAGGGRQAVSRRTGPAAGGCKHPPLRRGVRRSHPSPAAQAARRCSSSHKAERTSNRPNTRAFSAGVS